MREFHVAVREAKEHCRKAPNQDMALAEFADRLRKEGWHYQDVERLVASLRRLVLNRGGAGEPESD
jgi:hypothetical protein